MDTVLNSKAGRILHLLFLWLMVGFATGTLTLLGPARWVTGALRDSGRAEWESPAMWLVIALFVIGSFLLALWLHRRSLRAQRPVTRTLIPLAATAFAGLALAGWSNPAIMAAAAGSTEEQIVLESGPEFHFGAYPDRGKLEELKAQGFNAVVSLQHPAVVPMEPQGIAAEQEATAELGIEFIHAPMLPWVSDNEESLATIRRLVESGEGKYYVHCGLGRDRVNVVKAMVERMGRARIEAAPELKDPRTFADRVDEEKFLMERGNFQILDEDLWLVPWPNKYEGFGKLFAGQVGDVLVLMDPAEPEQAEWIAEARRLFGLYGVPHEIVPFPGAESPELLDFARRVRTMPRPGIVLVPYTVPCRNTRVSDAFLAAYERAGGPPASEIRPGAGDPEAEGRPLPCESG